MRFLPIVLVVSLGAIAPVSAQISVGIDLPGIDIGINMPMYPELVRVPGYPVYYAPRAKSNYFFYDGLYWVFESDEWYSSTWFNGPWDRIERDEVPSFVLRVPVRYYRQPPSYFRGWRADAPPRWGEKWGKDWENQRRGWDRWDRHAAPRAAPLPSYQRQYSGSRYPRELERQHSTQSEHYRYQPREDVVRKRFPQPSERGSADRTHTELAPRVAQSAPRQHERRDNPGAKNKGGDGRNEDPRKHGR